MQAVQRVSSLSTICSMKTCSTINHYLFYKTGNCKKVLVFTSKNNVKQTIQDTIIRYDKSHGITLYLYS